MQNKVTQGKVPGRKEKGYKNCLPCQSWSREKKICRYYKGDQKCELSKITNRVVKANQDIIDEQWRKNDDEVLKVSY